MTKINTETKTNKRGRSKHFGQAIAWFIASLLISNANDVIAKYLGSDLHPMQITFMRFFFGCLVLVPFMMRYGRASFATQRFGFHALRGLLLLGGIALWCHGLTLVPITAVTVLNFTIPLFTLVFALIFLKERVGWARWFATLGGFVGIYFIFNPGSTGFPPQALWLLLAASFFALLDVMNKRFVSDEPMLSMLFYVALATVIFSAIPAYYVWETISLQQWVLLAILGCGANLILFCLLKAFALADVSALAPFRYVELIFSALSGFLLFAEVPTRYTLVGALVIIPCALFVTLYDARQEG